MPLPALVDSHCHLDFPDFAGEIAAVVARAARRRRHPHGHDLHPPPPGAARSAPSPRRTPGVFWAAGTHPMHAAEEPMATVDALVALAAHPKFVGIGETGLDYHYTADSAAVQQESLRLHIEAARAHRPAAHRPRPRRRRRHRPHPRRGARRRPLRLRHALLHLGRGAGRDRARPRLLPLDLRHRHLPQRRAPCAPSSPPPRATACWSRPTAPTSRRSRTAASATSPPTPPTPPALMAAHLGLEPDEFAALTTANFDRLFAKAAA